MEGRKNNEKMNEKTMGDQKQWKDQMNENNNGGSETMGGLNE